MIQDDTAEINNEIDMMDLDLEMIRRQTPEINDLGIGMTFEDWQELYSLENTPGYTERFGQF